MKFFPPTDEAVQIGLTSGHMAIVEATGTELHPSFHKEAIARGCMPEGIGRAPQEPAVGFDKMATIIEAMQAMVDDGIEAEFTGDGKPDVRALSKRVGFTVSKGERDGAWDAVADEAPASTITDGE